MPENKLTPLISGANVHQVSRRNLIALPTIRLLFPLHARPTRVQGNSGLQEPGNFNIISNNASRGLASSVVTQPTTNPTRSGNFATSAIDSRDFIAPDGNVWHPQGVNVFDLQSLKANLNTTNGGNIFACFPHANFIRIPTWFSEGPPPPTAYRPYVDYLTSRKCVACFEIHDYETKWTEDQLNAAAGWYQEMASNYSNNPYVWFKSGNEPKGDRNWLNKMYLRCYNAVRSGGNLQPFAICMGLPPYGSTFMEMHNVILDQHAYNNAGYNRRVAQFIIDQNKNIDMLQSVRPDADGKTVPVVSLEFGDSGNSANRDYDWQACVAAVCRRTINFAGWAAFCMVPPDFGSTVKDKLNNGYSLTDYGHVVRDNMLR